jgi:hypothetical protein
MQRHEDLPDLIDVARSKFGWLGKQAERGPHLVGKKSIPLMWGSVLLLGICGALSLLAYGLPKWTRAENKTVSSRLRDAIPAKLRKAVGATASSATHRKRHANSATHKVR